MKCLCGSQGRFPSLLTNLSSGINEFVKYLGVVDWAPLDLRRFSEILAVCTPTNIRSAVGTVNNEDGVLSCFGLKGERGLFVG